MNILKSGLIALGILILPLIAQLTIGTGVDGQGFNWKFGDFIVIGLILFVAGALIEVVRSKFGQYKFIGIAVVVISFLWLYVELAVGLFTNWGS